MPGFPSTEVAPARTIKVLRSANHRCHIYLHDFEVSGYDGIVSLTRENDGVFLTANIWPNLYMTGWDVFLN